MVESVKKSTRPTKPPIPKTGSPKYQYQDPKKLTESMVRALNKNVLEDKLTP